MELSLGCHYVVWSQLHTFLMRAWEGFTAFFWSLFSWKDTYRWGGEEVYSHHVSPKTVTSCVLESTCEKWNTVPQKKNWGLDWTPSQVMIPCVACYNLHGQGVGSNHWDIKSTDQQLMSSSTKWELCHCFGFESLIKLICDFLCYVNIIKFQKNHSDIYLLSNHPSCNEFYSCLNGCKYLTWRRGCHSSGIHAFLNAAKPVGKTAGRRWRVYCCSRKLWPVTSCTMGIWGQNRGTSELDSGSVRGSWYCASGLLRGAWLNSAW